MTLYQDLLARKESLSLVGLGYVDMSIAVALAKKAKASGFDLNEHKIALFKSGTNPTQEAGDNAIRQTAVDFTADEAWMREAM